MGEIGLETELALELERELESAKTSDLTAESARVKGKRGS